MSRKQDSDARPWMKFFPADWQSDEGLGQCSLMARGLWIELIAIMHKSETYGHLLIGGRAPTEKQIANQVKTSQILVKKCLAELEKWSVFSRTKDGVIFCRRMVDDFKKDQENRQNGKTGGNPNLRKGVNPPDNPPFNGSDNGGDKAHSQKPDTREDSSLRSESSACAHATENPPPRPTAPPRPEPQLRELERAEAPAPIAQPDRATHHQQAPKNPQPSAEKQTNALSQRASIPPRNPCRSSPPGAWYPLCDSREIDQNGTVRGVVGGFYLDLIADEVCYAAQMRPDWGGDWTPLIGWLRDGIDPNVVIAPAIREVAKRSGYRAPASLRYFDNAVRDAHARQPKTAWRAA